jgi:hypothetical protein
VCPSTFKDNRVFINPLDQKPIQFNTAFPPVFEVPGQEMVVVFPFQRGFVNETDLLPHNGFDLPGIKAALHHQTEILFKLVFESVCFGL